MKKLLAIVLSVAMIACFAVVASAAEDTTATIATVEVTEASVGTKIRVPVEMSKSEFGYAAIAISNIKYDTEVLKLTAFRQGTLISNYPDGEAMGTGKVDAGTYGYICATKGSLEGSACVFEFEVIKAADSTVTADITAEVYKNNDASDPDTVKNTATVVAGGTKVAMPGPSDPGESKVDESKVDESKADESKADESKAAPTTVVTPGTTTNTTKNPKSGDASAVAVAGVLCAAMAAAFVITKKSK